MLQGFEFFDDIETGPDATTTTVVVNGTSTGGTGLIPRARFRPTESIQGHEALARDGVAQSIRTPLGHSLGGIQNQDRLSVGQFADSRPSGPRLQGVAAVRLVSFEYRHGISSLLGFVWYASVRQGVKGVKCLPVRAVVPLRWGRMKSPVEPRLFSIALTYPNLLDKVVR